MATTALWIAGARVRTLPAAVAPVLVGTGAAVGLGAAHGGRAALAAGVALALQIGVNYANDYSDGVKGTDRDRVGPLRLTGSGLVDPSAVRRAAAAWFALAALLGLALCALAGTWWLVAVGAAAVLAAWFYTGGRNPYGYRGLGEVAVFTFFGLVAVLGTTYTQAGTVSLGAVAGAVGIGSLACALLMANNIRDIPTDQMAGKRTLAVRLGDRRARVAYAVLVAVPFLLALALVARHPGAAATLVLALPAAVLARRVLRGVRGRDLILALRDTGLLELGYGIALGIALAL